MKERAAEKAVLSDLKACSKSVKAMRERKRPAEYYDKNSLTNVIEFGII